MGRGIRRLLLFGNKTRRGVYNQSMHANESVDSGDSSRYMVEARGLVRRFGETTVLDGVDLRAAAGDVVSILGSSGAGKSTLLRCLNVLEQPDEGELHLCGEAVALYPPQPSQLQRLRRQAPMVFQHINLWAHKTALQNVMEAPCAALNLSPQESRERALEMLDKVGVAEHAEKFPAHLSGGQQQRVGIARALAMKPAVILMDEPTSALDPECIAEVLQVLRTLAAENTTMLVVTHEIRFALEVSGKIVFLDRGKIAAEGKPDDIRKHEHPQLRRFFDAAC